MTEAQITSAVIGHWRARGVPGSLVAAMLPEEDVRSITGFPGYFVTSFGRVFSVDVRWPGLRELKPESGHRGHLRVTLYRDGRTKRELVHRLVLKSFDREPIAGEYACHWDDVPTNNKLSNLRWATAKDNNRDAHRNGRMAVGSRNHFSILDEQQVCAICDDAAAGLSRSDIARKFHISTGTVGRIITGRTWRHVHAKRQGRRLTSPKKPKELVNEAARLVNNGSSVNAASLATGVNRKTIIRILRPIASEKQIHSAVMEHWRTRGTKGSLVATMANEYAHGQPGLTPGLYDLLVIAPGFGCGFLELKTERGRLSHHQREFGAICDGAGVSAAVAYGLDEALRVLEQWGVLRRSAS